MNYWADKRVVITGGGGFLGSHVVKELVSAGRDVRVMVRTSSDTCVIDRMDIERVTGDITDRDAIASALTGCDSVFYCIVDTRAWLRDPTPLYQTNVEGLRTVKDCSTDLPLVLRANTAGIFIIFPGAAFYL